MNAHPRSNELAFGLLVTVKERNTHLKPRLWWMGGWVGGVHPALDRTLPLIHSDNHQAGDARLYSCK